MLAIFSKNVLHTVVMCHHLFSHGFYFRDFRVGIMIAKIKPANI
jgi:hypothetical protein